MTRRSVREFTAQDVPQEIICQILEAGRWAPSGLNNQPWRFVVVRDRKYIEQLSGLTKYAKTVSNANLLIIVLLDNSVVYDRTKDLQAIGACIQNMLLAIHELGLGACWIGEILNQKERVLDLLELSNTETQIKNQTPNQPCDCKLIGTSLELMAVLAIGYPVNKRRVSNRMRIEELVICWK
ncbi:MAG: nitroreductase family protein [bacterium]